MATPKKSTTPAVEEQSDAAKRRNAVNAAMIRLRDNHRDEFIALATEEAEKVGVTYTPKKTAEEKAAEQMAALLAEFPHLREQVETPSE